ncbi:MAG: PEP-utilizing enzyme [Candidatus Magasanikiibacteriota bacterium]
MSYKNYNWEVIASDYFSPFARDYLWTESFFLYQKFLDVPRLAIGIISSGKEQEYITDKNSWLVCHEALKKKALSDYRYVENIIDKSLSLGDKFCKLAQKKILNINIQKLSNEKLFSLFTEFVERQKTIYAIGTSLVIMDFQGFSFVENNLDKFLREKVSETEYIDYYKVFTEPSDNSFAQDQEIDLLKIISKFYNDKNWIEAIKNKSFLEIKNWFPHFYKLLQKHTKKHCWVYYVYSGPAYGESNFLEFIKDYLYRGIIPSKRLKELKESKKELKKTKKKYLKNLKPDKFNSVILNLAGKIVWAKPRRKDFQSKIYYSLEKIQQEIGRRLNLSLNQVRSTPFHMIKNALLGQDVDLNMINEISGFHACLPNDDGTVSVIFGDEAKEFCKTVKRVEANKLEERNEIKGTSTFPGKVRGEIKVINNPEDMSKMNYGDILLSTSTTPSIVLAMKKAAAIITDEGGLTCHASIVSRELQIPCVVGTKFATKILKDGDIVEVDAYNGIIIKL